MIYAIDFDNTLCINSIPNAFDGKPNVKLIEYIKKIKDEGHSIILWTCRTDEYLKEAVEWCRLQGLVFDAVNDNIPEIKKQFNFYIRKVIADYYIDDRNLVKYNIGIIDE